MFKHDYMSHHSAGLCVALLATTDAIRIHTSEVHSTSMICMEERESMRGFQQDSVDTNPKP